MLALIATLGFILPVTPAKADMGIAPPSMHFSIEYQIPHTDIVEGNLLLCDDVDCEQYQILDTVDYYSYGLPNFYCGGENDSEWCYAGIGDDNFGKYHRISLQFVDGVTRISNVFKKRGYSSYYTVVVNEVDLVVKENAAKNLRFGNLFSPLQTVCFIPSALITLITEVKVAKLYSKKIKKPIGRIVLANLISLPLVWFIIPSWLEVKFLWLLIIVESFAIIFEAIFIYYTNRSSGVTFKEGLITSLIVNLASIGVGVFLIGFVLLILFLVNIR